MRSSDPLTHAEPRFDLESVEGSLRDGDLVFSSGARILSSVVRRLTRGVYSHCGIVARWNGRPMLLHVDVSMGVHAIPLFSALASCASGFDWYSVRDGRRRSFDARALVDEAQAHLGMKYNLGEVVHAGAHVLLGAPAPSVPVRPSPTHCSAYVARCFRASGLPLLEAPDNLVSPDQLSRSSELVFRGSISNKHAAAREPNKGWKAMADELAEIASRALSRIPQSIREPVARARELESLLIQGEASIAALGPRLRATYEPLLRRATADATRARAAAQSVLEAFESGRATETEVVAAATHWSDEVARALWVKADEREEESDVAEAAAAE